MADNATLNSIFLIVIIIVHVVAAAMLGFIHFIQLTKKDKLSRLNHMVFIAMYCFIFIEVLSSVLNLLAGYSFGKQVDDILMIFLLSCPSLGHFFQFLYFYLTLQVLTDYIDRALYQKPTLFKVCKWINKICFYVMIIALCPSFALTAFDFSIKVTTEISPLLDLTTIWMYYSISTIVCTMVIFVISLNSYPLSYLTKDGISFTDSVSPLRAMITVDITASLFLLQSVVRFILYVWMYITSTSDSDRVKEIMNQPLFSVFQGLLVCFINLATICLLFYS